MWRTVLDFCFPPSESLAIIRKHPHSHLADHYHEFLVGSTVTLSTYQAPLIRACVTAGKFEYNLYAIQLLGTLLGKYIEVHNVTNILFVPIPLHSSRERERGYNQVTEIITAALKVHPKAGKIAPLLVRTKATIAQSHLGRSERLHNMQRAFAWHDTFIDWSLYSEVILVDDVVTTGATLEVAKHVLEEHLPSHVHLTVIALAH